MFLQYKMGLSQIVFSDKNILSLILFELVDSFFFL